MSYAVKYRKECVGRDGLTHKIDFLFDGYSGGVLSLGDATPEMYKLEVGALGADIFEPIRSSRLTLNLLRNVANVNDLIDDVENALYGSVVVNLYQGTTLVFAGLLETSLGDRGLLANDVVQFVAKTGFDYLDAIPFPTTETRMKIVEVWATALSFLPFSFGFFVDTSIQTASGVRSENCEIDTSVYKSTTNDGEIAEKSCLFVLRETLSRFLQSIVFFDSYWHVQSPTAYVGSVTFFEYDELGEYVSDDSDTLYVAYNGTSFIPVESYASERRKTAFTRSDITYKHGDLGGVKNGGFETWDGSFIESWTRSDATKIARDSGDGFALNDKDQNFQKHVRINPYFLPSANAAEALQAGAVYIENTEAIYLTSGANFTFAFRSRWTILNEGVFASESRAIFWRMKCGSHYWDVKTHEWTTTETINQALVTSAWTTITDEIKATPTSGHIEIRLYGGIDHIVNLQTGMSSDGWNRTVWEMDAGSGVIPNLGYFLFDAVDVVLKDSEGKSPTETRTSIATNDYSTAVKALEFLIGDGVTSTVKGRITYATTDTTIWDGYGISDTPLDELCGRALVRYLGRPQKSEVRNFLRVSDYVRPTNAFSDGDVYWANYWYYSGLSAQFGGEFTVIADFALASTKSTFKDSGVFRDLSGVALLRQQSQSLFNTGSANVLTRLSANIPSGSRNTLPIEAIGSLALKVGDKLTLVDRDTGILHTLVVRTKPSASATTLAIDSYNFPKAIRLGSPIYRHQGDLNAVVVQTDTVYRQMYQATGVCKTNGAQTLGASGTLNITPATAFVPSGTRVWVKNTTTTYVSMTLTQDIVEGSETVSFNTCKTEPANTTGGSVPNNTDVKPEGFASMTEIVQNASAIVSKASQTSVDAINATVSTHTTEIAQNAYQITLKASQTALDTTNSTVTTHTTQISNNANEITLRAERTKLIADINSVTQTSLRINPDKIILDGEVETTRSIRSANYVAGSSGWIISGNGNAEFRNVALRGTIIDEQTTGINASLAHSSITIQNGGARVDLTPNNVYVRQDATYQSTLTGNSLTVGGKHAVLFVSDNGTYITVSVNGINIDLEKH